jgi:hypothetical protein
MKKVVIFPGRFQPMLRHHVEVYRELQKQFPDADVYVATSDKVEPGKSPFNFAEKQQIITAQGISPDRILQVRNPYNVKDYEQYFDSNKVSLIFAVGEKDMARFPFDNVDSTTGLDMTVRGEPRPKYLQKINTYKTNPQPMSVRGYITLAPTVPGADGTEAKASDFRKEMQAAPDVESAKQVFNKQFGDFDQAVFELIYNKFKGSQMSEQLNILRKLAGLSEAPVQMPNFAAGERPSTPTEREAYRKWQASQNSGAQSDSDTEFGSVKSRQAAQDRPAAAAASDPLKAKFLDVSVDSLDMPSQQRKNSIANRFPANADLSNPEVKKDMFLKIAASSPYMLFSEINARLGNDDNSLAVSDRLSDLVSQFRDGKTMSDLIPDDKKFALRVMGNAINNMELVRATDQDRNFKQKRRQSDDDADNKIVDVGDTENDDVEADDWQWDADKNQRESINLDDIREEYKVNEQLSVKEDQIQSVDQVTVNITANNAFQAAMAELKKLAGV